MQNGQFTIVNMILLYYSNLLINAHYFFWLQVEMDLILRTCCDDYVF